MTDMNIYKQMITIAKACEETATRCDLNMLLAGTWVQESFVGVAERLRELANEYEKQERT